jgi:hypothetical protein
MTSDGLAVVAQGNLSYLRGVQRELAARGVRAEIVPPAAGCGSS